MRLFDISEDVLPSPRLVLESTWDDRAACGRPWSRRPARRSSASPSRSSWPRRRDRDRPLADRASQPLPPDRRLADAADRRPRAAGHHLVRLRRAPQDRLVALFTFFAVAVGLVQGFASTDRDAVRLLRTMGATRRQLLWRVRLPSALPSFFTGLKVAVTYAFVSAIVAEFVGAQQGSASTYDGQECLPHRPRLRRRARDGGADAAPVRRRRADRAAGAAMATARRGRRA